MQCVNVETPTTLRENIGNEKKVFVSSSLTECALSWWGSLRASDMRKKVPVVFYRVVRGLALSNRLPPCRGGGACVPQ